MDSLVQDRPFPCWLFEDTDEYEKRKEALEERSWQIGWDRMKEVKNEN